MVSPIRPRPRWRVRTLCTTVLFGVGAVVAPAFAGGKPIVPFEHLAKVALDEKSKLHYDDYAGKISEARIKRLLRSGPILGDRVLLQIDVAIYFPDGHVVSSKTEFHSYKPIGDLMPWNVYYRKQIEPNGRYALVAELDAIVGPPCAETKYLKGRGRQVGDSYARMRFSKSGVMTFEIEAPGRYDYLTGEITRSYTLTSAIDPYYLGDQVVVHALIDACRSGTGVIKADRTDG